MMLEFPFAAAVPCGFEHEEHFEVRPYVWIGEALSRTPTHYDYFNNVYLQVYGRKTFYLAPPALHQGLRIRSALHPAHRSTELQLSRAHALSYAGLFLVRVCVRVCACACVCACVCMCAFA